MYSKGLNCKNNNMNIGNHFIIILVPILTFSASSLTSIPSSPMPVSPFHLKYLGLKKL